LKLLAEPSRLRLLALLQQEELTVAELASISDLKQPRVSTHLAKLKEAGLVTDRRRGVQAFYRYSADTLSHAEQALVRSIAEGADDPTLSADQDRMRQLLRAREDNSSWADSVAGDMERHYSPGRTWESVSRALLQCSQFGDVLDLASGDGVLAELIAPRARSVTCIDSSARVANAARKRLKAFANTQVLVADMHALDLPAAHFDQALLLQALPYSDAPLQLFREVARVLKPGAQVVGSALAKHPFADIVAPFGHKNLGFTPDALTEILREAGLATPQVFVASRERKAPHFDVIIFTALAR
jgi:DNA-binding transcriptional ArsR family regulator/ubiquinone/menaquinone biosynthesis C-methylase UbiE